MGMGSEEEKDLPIHRHPAPWGGSFPLHGFLGSRAWRAGLNGWSSLLKCSQEKPVIEWGKQNGEEEANQGVISGEISWRIAIVWSHGTLEHHLHLGFVPPEDTGVASHSPAFISSGSRTVQRFARCQIYLGSLQVHAWGLPCPRTGSEGL